MLSQRYTVDDVNGVLLSRRDWKPFPKAANRDAWLSIPENARQALIQRGEKSLESAWPVLPAALALDFARTGNRNRFEQVYFERRAILRNLILAECVEDHNRFLEVIVNAVWSICEESSWCIPAHLGWQKTGHGLPDITEPYVDLFAGETSALLALAAYLLDEKLDSVSPLVVKRVQSEIQRRILVPLLEREDFVWTGFSGRRVNNWNPWIISNWLVSALLIEDAASVRVRHLHQAMRTLDNFIDSYPEDGGCDEGPMYWGRAGGSLYECLEWMHSATNGAVDVYGEPLIQNIGKFIYRLHIDDRYFVNFADAAPMLLPWPGGVYGYGKRIGDRHLARLGAWAAGQWDLHRTEALDSLPRQLVTLFRLKDMLADPTEPPFPRDVFLDNIEVFAARDQEGSSEGFFVAAKGGHNEESHNHNDVGQFVVYLDGAPVLVDAGVETYTAKTFHPEGRYTIWTMQSAYHNLPTVNGMVQSAGKQFAAGGVSRQADDERAGFSLELAGAYPEEAQIDIWQRTITLVRGKEVTLRDEYKLKSVTGALSMNLLTTCEPVLSRPGTLELKRAPLVDGRESGSALLHFDATAFDLELELIELDDERMNKAWGARLTRIVFRARKPEIKGNWTFRLTRGV